MSLFSRFTLKERIAAIFGSKRELNEIYANLEEILVTADLPYKLTEKILKECRRQSGNSSDRNLLIKTICHQLLTIFKQSEASKFPTADELNKDLILLVGINGCGKTTTAAKLAAFYRQQKKSILLAAADTFRAAGSSQLVLWGNKLQLPVISGDRGADPGSVIFNALQSFQANPYQLLIADTAGRLQNREQLLKELEKIYKISQKFLPSEKIHPLLVLDASTGQNALQQALKFNQFTSLRGIILTKLDGTARGGTIITIVDELKVPVVFITFGEGFSEIAPFNPEEFLQELIS